MRTVAEFTVDEGERVPFVLTWFPSHEDAARGRSTRERALADTETFWREWTRRCTYSCPLARAVVRARSWSSRR